MYINHIGDERESTYNLSVIVKSVPKMFAYVEDTEIHSENSKGEVTIKFVNNDLADIHFLTVRLLDGEDYEILSANTEYIGDLDSDDFESIDFQLSVNKTEGKIILPLIIDYKDVLNNEFSEEREVVLILRSAEELGLAKDNTNLYIGIGVVILMILYFLYRRHQRNKLKLKKY